MYRPILLSIFTLYCLTQYLTAQTDTLSYFENGQLKVKGQLLEGNKHGNWIWYYENGQIREIGYYLEPAKYDSASYEGTKVGTWKEFHSNGQLKEITYYDNGKRDNKSIGFFDNGDTNFVFYYKNGNETGKAISYFPNGVIEEISDDTNEDGLRKVTRFTEKGTKSAEGLVKNYNPVGVWKHYHPNGKVNMKVNMNTIIQKPDGGNIIMITVG